MSPSLADVLAASELLTVEERRALIDLLLEELDEPATAPLEGEPPRLSEAWRQEINKRSAQFDTGQAETLPWQELQARWLSRRSADG